MFSYSFQGQTGILPKPLILFFQARKLTGRHRLPVHSWSCGCPESLLRPLFLFLCRHSSSSSLLKTHYELWLLQVNMQYHPLYVNFSQVPQKLLKELITFWFPWDSGKPVRENLGNDICYYHPSETHHCWVKMSFVKVINHWPPHGFPQYNIKGKTHHFEQHQRSLV